MEEHWAWPGTSGQLASPKEDFSAQWCILERFEFWGSPFPRLQWSQHAQYVHQTILVV